MKTKGCAIDENCDLQKEFHWMKYWENKKCEENVKIVFWRKFWRYFYVEVQCDSV